MDSEEVQKNETGAFLFKEFSFMITADVKEIGIMNEKDVKYKLRKKGIDVSERTIGHMIGKLYMNIV